MNCTEEMSTNEELGDAVRTIVDECNEHSTCRDCPLLTDVYSDNWPHKKCAINIHLLADVLERMRNEQQS